MKPIIEPAITVHDINGKSATIHPSETLTRNLQSAVIRCVENGIAEVAATRGQVQGLTYEGLNELLRSLADSTSAVQVLLATTPTPAEADIDA